MRRSRCVPTGIGEPLSRYSGNFSVLPIPVSIPVEADFSASLASAVDPSQYANHQLRCALLHAAYPCPTGISLSQGAELRVLAGVELAVVSRSSVQSQFRSRTRPKGPLVPPRTTPVDQSLLARSRSALPLREAQSARPPGTRAWGLHQPGWFTKQQQSHAQIRTGAGNPG